jgi:hypothetical protein
MVSLEVKKIHPKGQKICGKDRNSSATEEKKKKKKHSQYLGANQNNGHRREIKTSDEINDDLQKIKERGRIRKKKESYCLI